ncbi:MAG: DMT family transporter [Paracoccaceae bacterium]
MVLAMAGFALEDTFIKKLTVSLPVGEVLILFGLGGMLVFALVAQLKGQSLRHPAATSTPMLLRAVCEVTGRLGYTLAIALTPLSSAAAILQATPLVVAAGAVVFFGEYVGPRRWLAIGFGFLGVLLILRPGLDGFTPASLFAVIGTLGFAGRDLATRAAPVSMSNALLGVYGFLMLVIAGALALAYSGGAAWPNAGQWAYLGLAVGFGVLAYNALTGAMRSGDIALVAPFRYTRLIFAMVIGITVFAERPDTLTLLGSAIIVASGLYTLFRSHKRASG